MSRNVVKVIQAAAVTALGLMFVVGCATTKAKPPAGAEKTTTARAAPQQKAEPATGKPAAKPEAKAEAPSVKSAKPRPAAAQKATPPKTATEKKTAKTPPERKAATAKKPKAEKAKRAPAPKKGLTLAECLKAAANSPGLPPLGKAKAPPIPEVRLTAQARAAMDKALELGRKRIK